jgi:hypothetical protein
MSKGTLKQSFLNGAHASLNLAGNTLAWTPVGGLVLANAIGNVWGSRNSLLDSAMRLDGQLVLIFAGMIAAGLATAGVGYARSLGGEPAARKSKLAHAFNFAASSVGAAAIAVGALATASAIDNGLAANFLITPALIGLTGVAAFTVGHKRLLGPTLPAPAPKQ